MDSSPWDEDTPNDAYNRDASWEKIASDFTNAGYREGITAGKEGALQEGFDSGFATAGAPLGRAMGRMRGITSALIALQSKAPFPSTTSLSLQCTSETLDELRLISSQLSSIRFSDIAPPDLEAEAHAREHMAQEGDSGERDEEMVMEEGLKDKRDVESLEDMLAGMSALSASGAESGKGRLTMLDFEDLKRRLEGIVAQLGVQVNLR